MPAPTVGQEQEEQPQRAERGILAINKNFAANATSIVLLPSQNGMVAALNDKNGDTIGADEKTGASGLIRTDDTMPVITVGDGKKVNIDMRALNNPSAGLGSGMQELTLKTDSKSEILLTNFTGQPPVRVEKGSDVDVQASSFMGFKQAGPGPDGKPAMTSANVSFQREQDGSLTILRDGKPAMNIPKDTKVDLKDNDGKTLMTIDANKDVEDIKKEYLAAEKKAFEKFQASAPDRSIKDATFRSGNEAQPAASGPQAGAPATSQPAQSSGMLGSMGSVGNALSTVGTQLKSGAASLGQQALNQGMQAALPPGLPRLPGTGGGRG